MKKLLSDLRKTSPLIEKNIFKSVANVHFDAILGYRTNNVKHSFLDTYDSSQ
jgi:hypothetical protein